MTDKLERLARIEAEAAALRKLIEAEQVKTPCFTPEAGETYWQLSAGSNEEHFSVMGFEIAPPKVAFRDRATAEAYAEAFNVMIELRLYADGGDWFISNGISPQSYGETLCLGQAFGGCYSSEAQARKAIDAVGHDRILRAVKTLCGVL